MQAAAGTRIRVTYRPRVESPGVQVGGGLCTVPLRFGAPAQARVSVCRAALQLTVEQGGGAARRECENEFVEGGDAIL